MPACVRDRDAAPEPAAPLSSCSTSQSSTAADGSMIISKPHRNVALPSAIAMQSSRQHHTHPPTSAGQHPCCQHSTARRSNVVHPHPHLMPYAIGSRLLPLCPPSFHPVHTPRGICSSATCHRQALGAPKLGRITEAPLNLATLYRHGCKRLHGTDHDVLSMVSLVSD